MLPRRWSRPLLAMVTVLLAFVSSVAAFVPARADAIGADHAPEVRAQLGGNGQVSVAIWTCDVVRAADVVTLTTSFYKPDGAYPCEDGLPDGTSLTIDGVAPNLVTDTTAIWSTVLYGTHTLSAGDKSTPLQFNLESTSVSFYALYERAQLPGGWVEVRIMDCAEAPVGTSVIVNAGDPVPSGFSDCVPGNTNTHNYGMLIDGQVPTGVEESEVVEQVRGGNHVVTVKDGGRAEFLINDWTVVLYAYFKGEVTGPMPPVDGLPNTGVGPVDPSVPIDQEVLPFAFLAASVALGYGSIRAIQADRE